MKKTFTLLMALALVMSMMAVPVSPKQFILGKQKAQTEQKLNQRVPAKKNIARNAVRKAAMEEGTTTTYTFSSFTSSDKVELTASNFNITLTKGTATQPAFTSNQARIYPGGTLVISSTNNITKIEYNYVVNANKSSKVPTIDGATGSKAAGTWTESTKTWTGSDTKVTFAISGEAGNVGFTSVTVTTDGQGGGGGEEEVTISGLTQAYAIYYQDGEGYYWDFDLAAEFVEESITYPEVFFMCDDEASSKTSIVGTYAAYHAGVWTSAKDSIETDAEEPAGTITVTYVEEGVYNFAGSFEGTDGKTYKWNATNVEVVAMDADNEYEIIELDETGGGGSQYSFDFTKDQQNWTINNVSLTGVTYVWKQDSQYGMKGTAYANKQANAAESWLVSPNIDLSTFTEATLKVKQAINKGASTNLKTKISTDGGSTWADLALNLPEGTSWDFQTDQVSLDAYVGDTIKIAFAYISTAEVCPTWEIMTVNITSAAGGDTIEVKDVDGLEIDFYPSYSSAGAYDYTFLLYNSTDEDYIPMVAFDILTATEKAYTGTYTMQGGTLTEYSYYVYGTGDDDYMEFTDGEITITDNGNGNYTIKGWFTDGTNVYSIDKTLDGEYLNAEYPYEPETKTTLNLTITEGEIDDSYASTYGIIDIYLTTADGDVQLEYYLPSTATTLEDGTYPIEAADYDEEGSIQQTYGFFDAGYYYSSFGMALASYYQTEEEIYYLVGGTVKVETVDGGTKITLAGTTYYGSTINAVYTISTSTALREAAASIKMDGKFLMNGQFVILKNNVLYNAQGQVVK